MRDDEMFCISYPVVLMYFVSRSFLNAFSTAKSSLGWHPLREVEGTPQPQV